MDRFSTSGYPLTCFRIILSQGARNVKNASSYGGVNAVGDGVTDERPRFGML